MEMTLAERCARALGWKKPSEVGRCDVCGWPVVPENESGCWASNCSFRPMPEPRHDIPPAYGESTERGRALTALLIERYGLAVFPGHDSAGRAHWTVRTWTAMRNGSCPLVHGDTLGHGVAEWVAAYVENGEQRP